MLWTVSMPYESPSDKSTSVMSKSPFASADIPCSKLVTWTRLKGKSLASSSSSCVNRASPGLSSIRRICNVRVDGAPVADMVSRSLRRVLVAVRQSNDLKPEVFDHAHDGRELF